MPEMREPQIFHHQYQSGFAAHCVVRPGFVQKFAGILVDFGSADPQALAGGAHFLEHKLFAKPQGDLAQSFEKEGAYVNAFTSYNETMFFTTTLQDLAKVNDLLFQLVAEPYFTDKNVNLEKPIIQQELSSYQADPEWKLEHTLLEQMFGDSFLAQDIAGNSQSLQAMTKDTLMDCYRAGYQPAKMHYVCCGDFTEKDCQRIFRQVGRLQKKLVNKPVAVPAQEEKAELVASQTLPGSDELGRFACALKLPNFKNFLDNRGLAQLLIEIMLESKLGSMSVWFARAQQQGLVASPLELNVAQTRQGSFAAIYGLSSLPERASAAVKDGLLNGTNTEADFTLQKRSVFANSLRLLDDLPQFATNAVESSMDHEDYWQTLHACVNFGWPEFERFSQQVLQAGQYVQTIMLPN